MIDKTLINKTIFSKELWKDSQPIYSKILEHPFILELAEGTLAKDQFIYYLQQDSLYLIGFARSLAFIATRLDEPSEIVSFLKFALGAMIGERELHEDYFKHYQIVPSNKKNDACAAYTDYLISLATTQSVEIAVAAVMPCFWVYHEVGANILANSVNNNPYEKWIKNYANEEFSLLVNNALEIAERMYDLAQPHIRQSMKKAAQQSVHLEWQFWDNAYHIKHFKIEAQAY